MTAPAVLGSWADATLVALLSKGHRKSGARRAIVELLRPATPLPDRAGDLRSVYRALQQLTRDGFHFVCDDCGKVGTFADDELERALARVERRTGYSVAGHDVVLRGARRDCAPAARV